MELERPVFNHQPSNIGINSGVILQQVNNNKLHQENKELVLSEKFAHFQLAECQRDKDVLVSEVALLERLLKQRQLNNQEEQTRLVQKYQSQFEKLRAECELQRRRIEPLEQQINELTLNEGVLIKQLAEQEIASSQHKTLLESVRKEADTLKVKLSGTVKELEQKTQTCFKQEQEIADLSLKAYNVSGVMEREKEFAIKEMKTKFEMEIQEMKLSLVNKQLTIKEKEEQLLRMQSELQDKSRQSVRLNEMSVKVAKLEIDNQKAQLKCRELKIVDKENNKKSEAVKAEYKRLQRKYEEIKKTRNPSTSEQTKDIVLIKRENLDLKSKLAIQEKTLRAEINRLLISKKKTEKKISKMERKVKNAEEKSSSSSDHGEDIIKTVRKLERENRRLKEDDEYNRKLIQDLRDERNNINDQMRSSEMEARRDVDRLKDRIKILENELMENEKEKNRRTPSSDKESLSREEKEHQELQQVDRDNIYKHENDRYSYEDDFEPESIAEDEEVLSRADNDDNKSITEKSVSLALANEEESVHSGKYDDDTFEEESVATLKSTLSQEGSIAESVVDGEACEESVPEIESDSAESDNGLFFGSKNVSLHIPKFPASVVSPNYNNNSSKSTDAVKFEREFVVGVEHAQKKESKPQAGTNQLDSVQQQQQKTGLVSLSDAPLFNNNKKGLLLKDNGTIAVKSKKEKKSKNSSNLNKNKVSAADIFGDVDSGKVKKKKSNATSSNNISISAADIFGTKTTTSKSSEKKNKNLKIGKAEQNDMKMLMNAQAIFGKFDNNNNNNNTKKNKVNIKQNKDLNRDLNSILGNL